MADNTVKVVLTGKDDTGPAFASAEGKSKAFQALMDQTTRKEIAAHQAASQAIGQHAKATHLLEDAEKALAGETENATSEVEKLAGSSGGGIGGVSGMGALIAAGAALSPALISIGFGLGGLGLAAAGAVGPVIKAAQAAGGLKANMSKLDPEQQAVARSLLSLQGSYDKFEKALAPTVLTDFNAAIKAARPLLSGLQPVAEASGKALRSVFNDIGAAFKSGQWKQFFQFMATEASSDIKILGAAFATFLKGLPGIVEALKPVSDSLLGIVQALGLVTEGLGTASQAIDKAGHSADGGTNLFGKFTGVLKQIGPTLLTMGLNIAAQHLKNMGQSAGDATPKLSAFASASNAAAAAQKRQALAVTAASDALTKGLAPLENYINDTITLANDSHNLRDALKASGDRIGYNTQKQRDSFTAAQQYIGDLVKTAGAAVQSHQGIDKQITSIQNALPLLESVKGKTAGYKAELAQLKHELDLLRAERNITKYVTVVSTVTGQGFNISQGGANSPHASGGIIGADGGGPRGSLTMVGEHGPELVRLPPGSQVHSNPDTQRLLSGHRGGDTYNIDVRVSPGTSPAEVGRQIAYYLGEHKKRGGMIYQPAGF